MGVTVAAETLYARLKDAEEKATPGPWNAETDDVWAEGRCLFANYFDYARDADAALVAAARNALPAVLRLIESVERFVKYAEEFPEDIFGPLRDDFLPQLPAALKPFLSEEDVRDDRPVQPVMSPTPKGANDA